MIRARTTLGEAARRLRWRLTPVGPSAASVPMMEYVKYHALTRFTPSFPQIIQIQTQYGCNARCVFCPMGREENAIHGVMDDAMFQRVVDEAVERGTKVISPYLQNDPLVDKRLHERIAYIHERRGRSPFPKTKIITNGGLLDEDRAAKLITSGLEYIVFSVHGVDPNVYDALMNGPRFQAVIDNVERFVRVRDELGATRPAIEVWAVRTRDVERQLETTRAFWKARGIRFKARQLDNRAHPELTENLDLAPEDAPWRFADHCTIPFWRAWVLVNGDVVLCCVDWERRHVFGNVGEESLGAIWNGEAYRVYRAHMRQREVGGTLCESCQGT